MVVIKENRKYVKSTLLEIYKDYIRNNVVEDNQIISINFESANYEVL